MADRVAVMYGGRLVEVGTAEEIFYNPQHPYTWGLLGSMPTMEGTEDKLYAIPGSPPDLLDPPTGDAFYPRNEFALKIDTEKEPPYFEVSPTHKAATWLLAPQAPKVTPPAEIVRRWAIYAERQKIQEVVINGRREKVLLEVTGLKQYFNVGRKDEVKAIDDISFHIYEGETFGLVGESGSGKSTTGRSVIRLYDPTAGEILFDGKDISKIKSKADMQAFRRDVQMIFQDPYASLNPRMKVNDIIAEGIDVNGLAKTPKEREEKSMNF